MIDKTKLQFLVGTADNGETVYGDFQTTGHFISSGHVGSGHASYDEGAFVTFLIQNYTPDDLQFIMIDPKMVQLTPYEGIPHLFQPVIFNPEDARDAVVDLLGEMDRRFNLLADSGVKNITEYNARSDDKLPFIILLCTEIADLMMVDGGLYGHAFSQFAMKARAVGIHMYLATQRPSVDVLPDVLLGLTFGRLIFAVASAVDSEHLLGNDSASKINEVGRLIFADYTSNIEKSVKANYVSDDEVLHITHQIIDESYTVPPCPKCGSHDIMEYVNGDSEMFRITRLENRGHQFIFNGCVLDGTEMDYHCNNCKNDYLDPDQCEEE